MLATSSADMTNRTFFRNIAFDINNENSSGEEEKEEGKPISTGNRCTTQYQLDNKQNKNKQNIWPHCL